MEEKGGCVEGKAAEEKETNKRERKQKSSLQGERSPVSTIKGRLGN
jgi:hypothetical protein